MFQAQAIFHQIYSNGEEFLARAPDPEDIIIEDNSNTNDNSTTEITTENTNDTSAKTELNTENETS